MGANESVAVAVGVRVEVGGCECSCKCRVGRKHARTVDGATAGVSALVAPVAAPSVDGLEGRPVCECVCVCV